VLIADVVGQVLVDHLGIDPARLVGTARLEDDLGLDSLALTEVLLGLEDELAISVPDPVQAELLTLADLVEVVASELAGRQATSSSGWASEGRRPA